MRKVPTTRLPRTIVFDSNSAVASHFVPSDRKARILSGITLLLVIWCGLTLTHSAPAAASPGDEYPNVSQIWNPAQTDSIYDLYHPRLLFDYGTIPGLYNKVRDGGHDDTAYSFIRLMIDYVYSGETLAEILDDDFGLDAIPMLGVGTLLESPEDENARTIGRNVTLYLANNYDVDLDDYSSSLRLRGLALGYDMFFKSAPDSQRTIVRDEIVAYIDMMLTNNWYDVWRHRPYLSNRSVMLASALGLGAICLADETDPARVDEALETADEIISEWLGFQLDICGTYKEGVLYGAWSMRNLIYYFEARKRYDGYAYGVGKIRKMENWFAYELLPEGNGKANNLNDSSYEDDPLPRHHTYFDWAQYEWGSNLSAWLYEHVAGPYGWDWGRHADKAATALWNQNLTPQQPDSVLPPSYIWEERGLYYYRSGWPSGASSDDLMFSFYSGQFHGGHAQEDQNQFTLYGYGAKFAIDHGVGGYGKQTESHNLVLIDDVGQHNAGASIGTDGKITQYLITDFADFVQGDATFAYTTHSVLNNYGTPFPGSDWSWGFDGGNPVNYARRDVIALHGLDAVPPYFVIFDDIEKDGLIHNYEWRLHTADVNTVDTLAASLRISAPTGFMDVHLLNPPQDTVLISITPYSNGSPEPDSKLLAYETAAVNPQFTFLLVPGDGSVPDPAVDWTNYAWGVVATIDWGVRTDVLVKNFSGGTVGFSVAGLPAASRAGQQNPIQSAGTSVISTDASSLLLRYGGVWLERYAATKATHLTVDSLTLVSVSNGPLSVARSGNTIYIDRYDADFTLYGPAVTEMRYRTQQVYFIEDGGFLTRDPITGVDAHVPSQRSLKLTAYPNPFNPSTTVSFELASRSRVTATVYDPLGRIVRHLVDATYHPGQHTLRWDAANDDGQLVASGVYLLLLTSGTERETVKLTVLK